MEKIRNSLGLQQIPGVGKSIVRDLKDIGINCIDDLIGKNPEDLYKSLCDFRKSHIDKCVLYVFRCAVYYAENINHEEDFLKWWNWKDK
jgi:hypothetical protein